MSSSLSSDMRLPSASMVASDQASCNIRALSCSYEHAAWRYAGQMSIALAVDLGGTKVEAVLVDEHGALLGGSRFREATGTQKSSAELESAVAHVVRRSL